jgi:hypothetical protein
MKLKFDEINLADMVGERDGVTRAEAADGGAMAGEALKACRFRPRCSIRYANTPVKKRASAKQ